MGKVRVRNISSASRLNDPERFGIARSDGCAVQLVIGAGSTPISLLRLRLGPGGRAAWADPGQVHCVFVGAGRVVVNGAAIEAGGTFVVEQGANATAESADGTELLDFVHDPLPGDAGGTVHGLSGPDVPRAASLRDYEDLGGAILADATCATCSVWLHENSFPPDYEVALHSHSEDEIIVVLEGEICLGPRRCGPGTALAIARDAVYGFTAGNGGMRFINYRPSSPTATLANRDEAIDEREFFCSRLGHPAHRELPHPNAGVS